MSGWRWLARCHGLSGCGSSRLAFSQSMGRSVRISNAARFPADSLISARYRRRQRRSFSRMQSRPQAPLRSCRMPSSFLLPQCLSQLACQLRQCVAFGLRAEGSWIVLRSSPIPRFRGNDEKAGPRSSRG
jgi:hypothetical protein